MDVMYTMCERASVDEEKGCRRKRQPYDRSPRRPNWNPNTVVADPGVGAGAGVLGTLGVEEDGPAPEDDPRSGVGLELPVARVAATMPATLANCGVVGLVNGDAGVELGVRPRIRCTMSGGTFCEPD